MIWSCCGPRRRSSVISLRGAAGARFGSLPNFSICSSAQAECFDFDLIMFLFVPAFCFCFWFPCAPRPRRVFQLYRSSCFVDVECGCADGGASKGWIDADGGGRVGRAFRYCGDGLGCDR